MVEHLPISPQARKQPPLLLPGEPEKLPLVCFQSHLARNLFLFRARLEPHGSEKLFVLV